MHSDNHTINHWQLVHVGLYSYFSNEDLRIIAKNCQNLQVLDLSGCDGLDQGIFKFICRLVNLR